MKYGLRLIRDNIPIILILILGLFLRLYHLGHQSFWFDEAISSIAAISLSENGTPVLPSGFVYSRSILNTFLIAVSFSVLGVSEFAGRFPSVIFGTLTILLGYHIGHKWGNKKIALIAAILLTFSVLEITWSRQARMYQQLQFFYLLSLYLFFEYVTCRDKKYFYLLVASFTATILSHSFGYSLIVIFLVYLFVQFLKHNRNVDIFRDRRTLYAAIIFLLLIYMAYEKGVILYVMHTQINYFDEYIYFLKKNLGFSLLIAVPGATVLMDREWKKGFLLIISILIPLYVIFFHVMLFAIRYLYFVIPIVFILAAFFIDFTIEYFSQIVDKRLGRSNVANLPVRSLISTLIIATLLVSMYLSPAFTFVPKDSYELGPNAPLSDFKIAYSYVSSNMGPEDVVISAWTAPAQFYLGKNDYWLTFNVHGTGYASYTVKNGSRDVYANSIVLNSTEMLENVTLAHQRGWIVVDNVAWYKISPNSKAFIENNTKRKLDDPTVRVYMWDYTNNSDSISVNSSHVNLFE